MPNGEEELKNVFEEQVDRMFQLTAEVQRTGQTTSSQFQEFLETREQLEKAVKAEQADPRVLTALNSQLAELQQVSDDLVITDRPGESLADLLREERKKQSEQFFESINQAFEPVRQFNQQIIGPLKSIASGDAVGGITSLLKNIGKFFISRFFLDVKKQTKLSEKSTEGVTESLDLQEKTFKGEGVGNKILRNIDEDTTSMDEDLTSIDTTIRDTRDISLGNQDISEGTLKESKETNEKLSNLFSQGKSLNEIVEQGGLLEGDFGGGQGLSRFSRTEETQTGGEGIRTPKKLDTPNLVEGIRQIIVDRPGITLADVLRRFAEDLTEPRARDTRRPSEEIEVSEEDAGGFLSGIGESLADLIPGLGAGAVAGFLGPVAIALAGVITAGAFGAILASKIRELTEARSEEFFSRLNAESKRQELGQAQLRQAKKQLEAGEITEEEFEQIRKKEVERLEEELEKGEERSREVQLEKGVLQLGKSILEGGPFTSPVSTFKAGRTFFEVGTDFVGDLFDDTPGIMEAGDRGAIASFAPGDRVVASQSIEGLIEQIIPSSLEPISQTTEIVDTGFNLPVPNISLPDIEGVNTKPELNNITDILGEMLSVLKSNQNQRVANTALTRQDNIPDKEQNVEALMLAKGLL